MLRKVYQIRIHCISVIGLSSSWLRVCVTRWWAGLATIPVLSRYEITPVCQNQLEPRCLTARRACTRCKAVVPPPHLPWCSARVVSVIFRGLGAPRNDGGRSFSTKERLAICTNDGRKIPIFREKNAFWGISGCRSENALLA